MCSYRLVRKHWNQSINHTYFITTTNRSKEWGLVHIEMRVKVGWAANCEGNFRSPKRRVTIFWKAKIGHWMTNFHETKFMAPPTFFLSKAGRWDAVAGLIVEVMVQIWNHRRKLGWSPKKKKRSSAVNSTICVIFKPESGKILQPSRRWPFFFSEITPIFVYASGSVPLPPQSSLQPHLTVPLLLVN